MSLEQLAETVKRAEEALTVEAFIGGVLCGLRERKRLAPFTMCVREGMCVNGGRLIDGEVRMLFVKSGFINGGFCPRIDDYDRALNETRASSVKGCVKREQRVYANPDFEVGRTMLHRFVLIQRERTRKEEVWAGRLLLLFHCLVKGESDGGMPAFVRYMERVAPLDEADETLRCVCMQYVTSGSGEEGDDEEKGRKQGARGCR